MTAPSGVPRPISDAAVDAIRTGHLPELRVLLSAHPCLSTIRLSGGQEPGGTRTLLHVATDWPGHFPHVALTIGLLVTSGAEVNARLHGHSEETPLHWAASSDDVKALDALLDAGAEIDAPGAVIAGGTPLTDAAAFGQWRAACRLVERGARTGPFDEAALGLLDKLETRYSTATIHDQEEIDDAFWAACHGGRLETSRFLLGCGANVNRLPGWERTAPLDAAARSGAHELITWLHRQGARTAAQLSASPR